MTPVQQPVPVATAMGRGFKMKCPLCGTGDLFSRFLKIADHCPACREEFHHHRADDFPAYLVIVVVGHIIVPAILAVAPNSATMTAIHTAAVTMTIWRILFSPSIDIG